MARTLNSPVADQRGEFVYLYEINHSGGVIRVTNASRDVTALSQTWQAVGGILLHGATPDTSASRSQGVDVRLYGVDQTIIAAIQNNQFRGRIFRIYLMHLDPDTGVQSTPDLIFQGRQNSDYRVTESRDPESQETGGQVEVRTRVSADLAAITTKVSVRCTVSSHEEMLRRGGVAAPDDTFFSRVASLMNKQVFWGRENPEPVGHGGGGRVRVPDDDETQLLGWQ